MRFATALAMLTLLSVSNLDAAELKSGLQVGDYPFPFYVADVTGPAAGQKLCYRCNYGARPVVNIFTRKIDANVTKLVKEIDEVVGKNRENRMAAFVVVLTDEPSAQEASLRKTAESNSIRHTPLTVFDNSKGPGKYKLSDAADVTVMMWVEDDVKVNHAFRLAELNTDMISKVVGDTQKILN